ncbi:MAG: RDD family protein [Bradyrhizobiaceae bacterium]|nr:RDD family protein [Bradyrhizobiaceae bacterium]
MSTNPFYEGGTQPPELHYNLRVGFGPRLGAFIIDVLASILFALALIFPLKSFGVGNNEAITAMIDSIGTLYETMGISTDILVPLSEWMGAWMLATVIANISYSLIEGLTGASPGKRVLRLVIVRPDGTPAPLSSLLGRWAIKNINAITSFIALAPGLGFVDSIGGFLGFVVFIGFFFMLSEKRQALHDIIAHTVVHHRISD